MKRESSTFRRRLGVNIKSPKKLKIFDKEYKESPLISHPKRSSSKRIIEELKSLDAKIKAQLDTKVHLMLYIFSLKEEFQSYLKKKQGDYLKDPNYQERF